MAHDVFLSYAMEDRAVADAVCAALEGSGIRCWMAPRDLLPGASWAAAIVEAIQTSKLLVLVFSAAANASPQVLREVERAEQGSIPILPFRVDQADPSAVMQYCLGNCHWLDATTPPLERHLSRLVADVSYVRKEWQDAGAAASEPGAPAPGRGTAGATLEQGVVKERDAQSADRPSSVFISFKNLDNDGRETRDCEMARGVARYLRQQGISVFFSLDSLEQLGTSAYTKAIDHALDEARVLIAVGTSRQHFESEWVRYEWDSFLNDIRSGVEPQGEIFVVTEGIRPQDLPRGLRQRQVFRFEDAELARLANFIRRSLS